MIEAHTPPHLLDVVELLQDLFQLVVELVLQPLRPLVHQAQHRGLDGLELLGLQLRDVPVGHVVWGRCVCVWMRIDIDICKTTYMHASIHIYVHT